VKFSLLVIPAKAGIHLDLASEKQNWIPAFAEMTARKKRSENP